MRLVFKNAQLETLAEQNLKRRLVLALQYLTVSQFKDEVLQAMRLPRNISRSKIEIRFYGKSARFPITFQGGDLIEKVFKKICSIEESRELSKNSSGEELPRMNGGAAAATSAFPQVGASRSLVHQSKQLDSSFEKQIGQVKDGTKS